MTGTHVSGRKMGKILWAALMTALFCPAAFAFEAQMPPLEESRAFHEYALRPESDLSRLIYLIDRFKEAKIDIVYGGLTVQPQFAAGIAKWFLSKQYEGQTARQWIIQWCSETVPSGEVIWVRDSQGKYVASRALLFEELEKLEKACEARCHEIKAASPNSAPAEAG